MYTHMSKILGCRLPWLAKEECSNGGKSEQLPCQTAEEFAQFMTISEQLISMDEAQFQEKTGCDVPCSFFHYETKKVVGLLYITVFLFNNFKNDRYTRMEKLPLELTTIQLTWHMSGSTSGICLLIIATKNTVYSS